MIKSSGSNPIARKPKIIRLLTRNVGGPAWQVCKLHEKLGENFETRLVTGALSDGDQDMSYLLSSKTHVLRVPEMSREVSLWSDLRALWKLLKYFRAERPDIVHTHTAKAGAIGRLAAWLAGVPIVVHTYHGLVFDAYFNGVQSWIYLKIERILGRLSTRLIAISNSQLRDLSLKYRVAPTEKFVVIQNGFELDRFSGARREDSRNKLGLSASDFVVVWAGRMAPVKDVKLLADAIRTSLEKHFPILFLVLGEGPEKRELERLTKGCENVRLLGWRRDMETIWAAADAALVTSRNEGTPTVLIEAMAAGRPFVSTNVGGVRDLAAGELTELPDGNGFKAANGYLAHRTPESLLYCIRELSNCPQMAREMGSAGQAFALDRFGLERLVEELTAFYQSLLRSRHILDQPSSRPTVIRTERPLYFETSRGTVPGKIHYPAKRNLL
ncbi:MAG TPA: glycosyltransferase [Candidatus Acidoferrales bacterium]|nr:glycosyltransferase [Candidatus Acidoferrales bacterium]